VDGDEPERHDAFVEDDARGIEDVGEERTDRERREHHAEAVAEPEGDEDRDSREHDDPAVTARGDGAGVGIAEVPAQLGEDLVDGVDGLVDVAE
jgi:hypothetical protein